ncbi:SDR family NAD(P)-dependent oxidoreductase [Bradyrhizobium jicamae]|uniref:SDR family NAD(P)-dependent oxidoreductase n=1 Tax=Bradyrhizobium jicamae TaxID=280332 RepID=UPI001BA71F39|nr:SDR family NAD(P)-dependent oxidoreductase [Bradyrhizobium jicamae]MBR0754418.1 SDR family NAD(P)-dependent oxidoreductase [Bradyrhizobium jicamae]
MGVARRLEGRVALITGAGRGLGAAYALSMARHGAKIVINDLGVGLNGGQEESDPAAEVVAAIRAGGGEAIIDHSDVADFDAAKQMVDLAVDTFGSLDILVNNAGILRDRMLVNMSVEEWDEVIRVHLRGHFCTTSHAATYWRDRAKSGRRDSVVIQTSSIAGLHGNIGQTNYSTAKSAIATMAYLNHLELNDRLGVRAYAIAPNARTRLTLNSPGAAHLVREVGPGEFDYFNPENVAKFVSWLAAEDCPAPSGTIYSIDGDTVRRYDGWRIASTITNNGQQWTLDALDANAATLARGHERAFTPLSEVLAPR